MLSYQLSYSHILVPTHSQVLWPMKILKEEWKEVFFVFFKYSDWGQTN